MAHSSQLTIRYYQEFQANSSDGHSFDFAGFAKS